MEKRKKERRESVTGHEPVLSMDLTLFPHDVQAIAQVWVVHPAPPANAYPAGSKISFSIVSYPMDVATPPPPPPPGGGGPPTPTPIANPAIDAITLAVAATTLVDASGSNVPSTNPTVQHFTIPATQAIGVYLIVGKVVTPSGATTYFGPATFTIH